MHMMWWIGKQCFTKTSLTANTTGKDTNKHFLCAQNSGIKSNPKGFGCMVNVLKMTVNEF
jgi:hypothetical protein